MTALPYPTLLGRRLAAWLLFAVLATSGALAQNTGTLGGRVSDASTGKSLQGAVVRVLGTPLADYTDADGRYNLPSASVPAGMQRVEVDYVGLDPFQREINIATGTPARLNVSLESTTLKLEAFTVAESVRGQALAINQQKTASGIVNIVSEETFGQMVNGNIGYALERLPGLTFSADEDGTPQWRSYQGENRTDNPEDFTQYGFRAITGINLTF